MPSTPSMPVVEMTGIGKSFGGVPVLRNVDLRLDSGTVVGLLGANGAGKSTLIKILSGVYSADSGTISVDGQHLGSASVTEAQRLGIRTVHQELSLVPSLRVYENVYLHAELTKGRRTPFAPLDRETMIRESRHVLRDVLGIEVDVRATVEDLPIATRQLVEIARAVHERAKVLVLDEPTTSLEAREKAQLFQVVRDLRNQGVAVIFISHHLDEVTDLCDRTIVLRDGAVVVDAPTAELSARDMVTAMTGRLVDHQYPKKQVELGEPVLAVAGLTREPVYRDVSFVLRRGEILGVVGLAGSGKTELIRGLAGSLPAASGSVTRNGSAVRLGSIRQARRLGLIYLPSDRKVAGIFPEHSVAWNTTISALQRIMGRFGLSPARELSTVNAAIDEYGMKVSGPDQVISRLSGGNQQKVMLARSLLGNADVLLLEDPTRGIDVAAKNDVYELITSLVEAGKSVVLVSSEETEVLGMCDQILVMREGRVRANLAAGDTSLPQIRLIAMSSEGDDE